jgi:hypothetical protein
MKHVINNNTFGRVDIPNPLPNWTASTPGLITNSFDLSDGSTKIKGFASMFRLYEDRDGSIRLQVKQDGQWIFVPTVKWYEEEIEKL